MNAYREAAVQLAREVGVTVRRVRRSMTGVAWTKADDWGIEAPDPRGPVSFGVFAHEVAHQVLHRGNSLPRWLEEIEAEEYAVAQFDRFGLPGRERYERHAEPHLTYAASKALRRAKNREELRETISARLPSWYHAVAFAAIEATAVGS